MLKKIFSTLLFLLSSNFASAHDGLSLQLSKCNAKNIHAVSHIAGHFFSCNGYQWEPIEMKGQQGDRGLKGDKGEKGNTGEIGPIGLSGERGEKGERGEQGIQGEQGLMGPTGSTGEKGDKGEIGLTGAQGEQGLRGPIGLTGEKGERGEVGQSGEKGEHGTQGVPGKSGRLKLYENNGEEIGEVFSDPSQMPFVIKNKSGVFTKYRAVYSHESKKFSLKQIGRYADNETFFFFFKFSNCEGEAYLLNLYQPPHMSPLRISFLNDETEAVITEDKFPEFISPQSYYEMNTQKCYPKTRVEGTYYKIKVENSLFKNSLDAGWYISQ